MRLVETFEPFLQRATIAVMYRAAVEHAIDPRQIDELFEREATTRDAREMLFSTSVELMAAVVLGIKPSIRSAGSPPRSPLSTRSSRGSRPASGAPCSSTPPADSNR